jgi:hypothetical protein
MFAFVEMHEKVARRTAGNSCDACSPPSLTKSTRSLPTMEPTSQPQAMRARRCRTSRPPLTPGARLGVRLRMRLRPERYRSPADKAQASVDQWASRKNEPHDQGRDCQTLLLRDPRPVASTPAKTSSTPTTSPDASKPSAASPHMSSSAKLGLHSHTD